MFQKGFEFDFTVTQDVGVGCSACPVLTEKLLKDIFPVFSGKIAGMKQETHGFCDSPRIRGILGCRALAKSIIFLPVLHEHASNIQSLLL